MPTPEESDGPPKWGWEGTQQVFTAIQLSSTHPPRLPPVKQVFISITRKYHYFLEHLSLLLASHFMLQQQRIACSPISPSPADHPHPPTQSVNVTPMCLWSSMLVMASSRFSLFFRSHAGHHCLQQTFQTSIPSWASHPFFPYAS